ncbi:MAG: NINE protein [Pseudomonadota bacterium]
MFGKGPRSVGVAFLLWLLLGTSGVHRGYVGDWRGAIMQFLTLLISILILLLANRPAGEPDTVILGLGVAAFALWFLWIISDVFRIPSMVRRANAELMDHGRDREDSVPSRKREKPQHHHHYQRLPVLPRRRPSKSMATAYLLWFFLCGLGAHRFYLKRPLSGLFLLMINLSGVALAFYGATAQFPEYVMAGGTCLLAVFAWWILDAFFIPGWVRHLNGEDEERSYVSAAAVNMDPSFSATFAAAGRDPDAPPRPALSDDLSLPWRQERKPQEVLRYSSYEDEPGPDDDPGLQQEADDNGHPPR